MAATEIPEIIINTSESKLINDLQRNVNRLAQLVAGMGIPQTGTGYFQTSMGIIQGNMGFFWYSDWHGLYPSWYE